MLKYYLLNNTENLPTIADLKPFKAIVVIDLMVTTSKQKEMSEWLVSSGCLYMMAWGLECSSWDDSVDIANCEAFEYGEIPDCSFVMTTWHESEPVEEAFWFAKNCAVHPTVDLENTLIIHINDTCKEKHLLGLFLNS
jgi:hypothetical protein